jgi:hypothetical protein
MCTLHSDERTLRTRIFRVLVLHAVETTACFHNTTRPAMFSVTEVCQCHEKQAIVYNECINAEGALRSAGRWPRLPMNLNSRSLSIRRRWRQAIIKDEKGSQRERERKVKQVPIRHTEMANATDVLVTSFSLFPIQIMVALPHNRKFQLQTPQADHSDKVWL